MRFSCTHQEHTGRGRENAQASNINSHVCAMLVRVNGFSHFPPAAIFMLFFLLHVNSSDAFFARCNFRPLFHRLECSDGELTTKTERSWIANVGSV